MKGRYTGKSSSGSGRADGNQDGRAGDPEAENGVAIYSALILCAERCTFPAAAATASSSSFSSLFLPSIRSTFGLLRDVAVGVVLVEEEEEEEEEEKEERKEGRNHVYDQSAEFVGEYRARF